MCLGPVKGGWGWWEMTWDGPAQARSHRDLEAVVQAWLHAECSGNHWMFKEGNGALCLVFEKHFSGFNLASGWEGGCLTRTSARQHDIPPEWLK